MEPRIPEGVTLDESSGSTPLDDTHLNTKVRDKLQKLDRWRVNASQLKLAPNGPRIEGGFAVVSRAFLVVQSPSSSGAAGDAATDPQGDVEVAVKMLKIKEGDVYRVLKRAVREADIIKDLDQRNIIKLQGFVEDIAHGNIWLIFPWAEMGNVREFIASENWSIPERIRLIDDVARGVDHLHSQDPPIWHGDLKSINILVNAEPRAIITDFGSARRLRDIHGEDEQKPSLPQRTAANETTLSLEFCQDSNTMTFTGTEYSLRWVAPEVLGEEDAGTPADIWSMGWVFYEIMTGSIPFENLKKDVAIVHHIMKGEFPSLKDHNRMSPILSLVSLMTACWEIDPKNRPSAERCRKYVSQMPMTAPRSSLSPSTAPQRAKRLFREGLMYNLQNDYDKALAVFNDGLAGLGDQARSTKEGGDILWGIAEVHRLRTEFDEGAALYAEVVKICEDIRDREGKAAAQHGLATIHRLRYEYDEAAALYTELIQISEEIGYRGGKADGQWGLAEVHRARGEYDEAALLYTEVVKIREEIGDRNGKAEAKWGLAQVHQLRHEYDAAAALYPEIVQINEQIGDQRGKASAKRGLARVHLVQREFAESLRLFMESSQLCQASGDRLGLAYSLRGLADVYHGQKHFKDATKFYEEAAELFIEIGRTQDATAALECANDTRQIAAGLLAKD